MKKKSNPKPDDPAEYKRFLEAAREAEADESSEAADKAIKRVSSTRKPETKRP
jgi:hypothetical protein